MYDFILFENQHKLENHYIDLVNFARLLSDAGYRVAFAHVFKEKELIKESNIDFIEIGFDCPKFLMAKRKYNPIIGFVLRFLCSLYLIYAVFALRNKAKNFYIGSLTLGTPILWMLTLSAKKNYFIWGLRCYYLETWKHKRFSLYGFYSWCLYRIITSRKNIKLVLSHPIIKEEFINRLRICEDRIIVRPERFIRESVKRVDSKPHEGISLLTIGTLRRSKHVEFVLDALRKLNNKSITYVIAGRCKNDHAYDMMVSKKSEGVPGIIRINRFIDDYEYENLINECDYLVLCDQPEPSCATNGTMAEAILHGKPIIAPNFNPFKYEIEKYNVGLLYDYQNEESLCKTLLNAVEIGNNSYSKGILKYINTHTSLVVINNLKKQLIRIL